MSTTPCLLVMAVLLVASEGQVCSVDDDIGEKNPRGQKNKKDDVIGTQFIMTHADYKFACCGVLARWQLYAKGKGSPSGTITLQLWRPVGDSHQLLWSYPVLVQDNEERYVSIPPSLSFTVKKDDAIGWYTDSAVATYKDGGKGAMRETMAKPALGANVSALAGTTTNRYAIRAISVVNNAPKFVNLPSSDTYAKNALNVGDILLSISATDPDPHSTALTFTATGSPLLTLTGQNIEVAGALAATTHTFSVTVTDECGKTDTQNYSLTITNTAPDIVSLPTSVDVSENNAATLILHTLSTSDADDDAVTCTYTGPHSTLFTVSATSPQTVQLQGSTALDYDITNHYVITIDCSDGSTSTSADFDVYVTQNAVPVITNLQNTATVPSTAAVNSNVFSVTSTDLEGDVVTYSHYCTEAICPFQMNNGTGALTLSQSLLGTARGAYSVYVTACDARGCSQTGILTVYVTDLQTQPAIVNLPNTVVVYENSGSGLLLFSLRTQDEDGDTSFTFTLTSSPTTTKFAVNNTCQCVVISAGSTLDFESDAVCYELSLTASDAHFSSMPKTLTVNVLNVNEVPVLSVSSYDISHGEDAGGTALPLPAYAFVDPDLGDSHTYWLAGGVNSSVISINSVTGQPSFVVDYDYDTAPVNVLAFLVEIRDSGGLSTTATVTLSISDVNDNAPDCGEALYVIELDKDSTVGTDVFAHVAIDADSGSNAAVSYSLDHTNGIAGSSSTVFTILSSGSIYLATSLSTLTVDSVNVTVTATDGGTPQLSCSYRLVVRLVTRSKKFVDVNLDWLLPLLLLLGLAVLLAGILACRHGSLRGVCDAKNAVKWTPPAKSAVSQQLPRGHDGPRPLEDHVEALKTSTRTHVVKATTPTEVEVVAQNKPWESWNNTSRF